MSNDEDPQAGGPALTMKEIRARYPAAWCRATQAAKDHVRTCTRCTRPATHYVKDELGVTEGVAGDLLCGRHAAKCGLPTRALPVFPRSAFGVVTVQHTGATTWTTDSEKVSALLLRLRLRNGGTCTRATTEET